MKTQCPNCKARFNVDDKYAGKQAKCPKCTKPFTIEPFVEKPTVNLTAEHPSTNSGQAAEAAEKKQEIISAKPDVPPASPAKITEPAKIPVKIAEPVKQEIPESKPVAKKTLSKALFVYVWAFVRIVAGIAAAWGLMLAIRKETNSTLTAVFAGADVFLIGSVAIELMLFYRMWAAIKDSQTSITPGKAVGFLFIPVFNIYWALCMVIGFAEDYNSFIQRRAIKTKVLPMTLYMIYAFALMLSIIFVTTPMLCVFGFVGLINRAFTGYAGVSWGLLVFISAVGIGHFITYILFALKTCNAVNALGEKT